MRKSIVLSFICSALLADTKLLSTTTTELSFDSTKVIDRVLKNTDSNSGYNSYKDTIARYAKRYNLEESLIAAIIKVESNYDKQAISSTNAVGLMQLKLDQAVSDVYKSLYGRSDLPSATQLLEPQLNISIGSAYLSLVSSKYFKDIKNEKTKQYCLIAAYNAGAGTVLRTFHEDKTEAQSIINTKTPDEVLEKLKTKMASEQGRRYILKVLAAKLELEKVGGLDSFEPNFLYVNTVLK